MQESVFCATERDTWLLVKDIYNDRATRSAAASPPTLHMTERQVWEHLHRTDHTLRELQVHSDSLLVLFPYSPNFQLIVKWLEKTAVLRLPETYRIDATWKHTRRLIDHNAPSGLLQELDPDAPCRTAKALHEDDRVKAPPHFLWVYPFLTTINSSGG